MQCQYPVVPPRVLTILLLLFGIYSYLIDLALVACWYSIILHYQPDTMVVLFQRLDFEAIRFFAAYLIIYSVRLSGDCAGHGKTLVWWFWMVADTRKRRSVLPSRNIPCHNIRLPPLKLQTLCDVANHSAFLGRLHILVLRIDNRKPNGICQKTKQMLSFVDPNLNVDAVILTFFRNFLSTK